MNKLSLKYGLLFFVCGVLQAKVEREVTVKVIERRLDNKLFSYRIDLITGTKVENTKKEQWTVDGKTVEQNEYEELIDQAILAECKKEREKEQEALLADYNFKLEQRKAITKKMLNTLVSDIEKKCFAFQSYELEKYMAFSPSTIESEIDFANIAPYYLEPARQLVAADEDDFSFEKAEKILDSLQEYPKKITHLFEDTVKKAVDHCDNTQRLKKLLEVIS